MYLTFEQIARTHHVQAESYLVYNIVSSGEIECSNTLEDELDQALPSQAFIYRPVRQRVYSLLLGGSEGEDHGEATGSSTEALARWTDTFRTQRQLNEIVSL